MRSIFTLVRVLLAFCAIVFLNSGPASAQTQTFYYIGSAFDVGQCTSHTGFSAPPCMGGSLTASVTLLGVTPSFTGSLTGTSMASFRMTAGGVGSVNSGQYWDPNNQYFTLSSGQITGWGLSADDSTPPTNHVQIVTTNGPGGSDYGYRYDASFTLAAYGYVAPPAGIWINPKSFGIACARPGSASCAEPIDIGSGNMFTSVADYATVGQNPLGFTRYYNSMSVPDTYAVTLGANWRHNFDRYLHIINPSAIYGVEAERPDGQVIGFASSSGTYTTDSDLDYTLTKSGSTWTLTDPDDTVETYTASGGKATLNSIKLRNGYTQTMTYSSGKLTAVSDSYSRALGISYSSVGLLAGVTTPDALVLSYGYVAFSSSNLLQTVTYNTSPATHQTYLYENTSYPFALTGITDENGHRYATWTYDGSGRATSSKLGDTLAADLTQISYSSTGNRTVTGPLGIVETYKFTTLQGVPKVTEIDRAAASGRLATCWTRRLQSSRW